MGAGNTLRWIEHPELRARMDEVVDGIAEYRQDNGYIMGYPQDAVFDSESEPYARSWTTHGLIEAGRALVTQCRADVVVMGCAGMASHRAAIADAIGVPVIEPAQQAVAAAIGAVLLNT